MNAALSNSQQITKADVYTWVVTANAPLPNDVRRKIATVGPAGNRFRLGISTVIRNGKRFKLFDEHGHLRFTGYIRGSYTGCEPLEDFGRDNGCSVIDYDEVTSAH